MMGYQLGEHQIQYMMGGYFPKKIKIKTMIGYQLGPFEIVFKRIKGDFKN